MYEHIIVYTSYEEHEDTGLEKNHIMGNRFTITMDIKLPNDEVENVFDNLRDEFKSGDLYYNITKVIIQKVKTKK